MEITTKAMPTTMEGTILNQSTVEQTTQALPTTVQVTQPKTSRVIVTTEATVQTTVPDTSCHGTLPVPDAPVLTYQLDSSKTFISLECSFNNINILDAREIITYTTTWYVGSTSVLVKPVNSGTFKTIVKSTEIPREKDPVTNGIRCTVNASSTIRCGVSMSKFSNMLISNSKVDTNNIYTLSEGLSSVNISVNLGIKPDYICLMKYGKTCQIIFKGVVIPISNERSCPGRNPLSPFVIQYHGNGQLTTAICGTVMSKPSASITMKAVVDGVFFQSVATRNIKIQEIHLVDGREEFKKEWGLKTINIKNRDFENPKKGLCSVTGDPHIRTFNSEIYDNFMEGEFILYKRKGMEYEVRGFFTRCGFGSCMCGVAIRSGDDVIVFDKCIYRNSNFQFGNSVSFPLDIRMYVKGTLTPSTKVYSNKAGIQFWVVLPTGTFVIVKPKFASYMNVFIDAVASDIEQTEGACGLFRSTEDLDNTLVGKNGKIYKNEQGRRPNEFSKEWRVPPSESIYLGYSRTLDIDVPIFCSCVEDRKRCGYFSDAVFCKSRSRLYDITDNLISEYTSLIARRKRRAVTGFSYNSTFGTETTTTNAWPAGITEADARRNCTAKLEATQAKSECSTLLNSTFTTEIDNCMADIRLTGNIEWTKDVSSTILTNCESQLDKTSSIIPESTKAVLSNVLCECNGNGVCKNGECLCNSGFTGDTCSINMNETPIISSPNVCNQEKCSVLSISGVDFFNSSSLSCYYTPLVADSSGIRVDTTTSEEKMTGNFVTAFKVTCPLNSQKDVQVQLKLKDLKSATIGVYLTQNLKKCFTPKNTLLSLNINKIHEYFTIKKSCCFIDKRFYTDGEGHPIDSLCKICSSQVSNSSWTYQQEKESCQRPRNEGNLTVIITSIVAACVLLLIITFLGVYFAKWYKMKERISVYQPTLDELYEPIYDGSHGIETHGSLNRSISLQRSTNMNFQRSMNKSFHA